MFFPNMFPKSERQFCIQKLCILAEKCFFQVKLEDALAECERTKGSMAQGPLWLSVGGGNCNAAAGGSVAWSEEVLQDFLAKIKTVDLSSYKGRCFLGLASGQIDVMESWASSFFLKNG